MREELTGQQRKLSLDSHRAVVPTNTNGVPRLNSDDLTADESNTKRKSSDKEKVFYYETSIVSDAV